MASSSYLVDLSVLPADMKWLVTAMKDMGFLAKGETGEYNETCFVANSANVREFMETCSKKTAELIQRFLEMDPALLNIEARVLQTAFITQASFCLVNKEKMEKLMDGLSNNNQKEKQLTMLRELKRKTPNWDFEWEVDVVTDIYRDKEKRMSVDELQARMTYKRDPNSPWKSNGAQVWDVTATKGFVHGLVQVYAQPYKNEAVMSMRMAVERFLSSEERPPGFYEKFGRLHSEFALVGYNCDQVIERLCQYNEFAVRGTVVRTAKQMFPYVKQTAYTVYKTNDNIDKLIAFRNPNAIWYPLFGAPHPVVWYSTAAAVGENLCGYNLLETQALIDGDFTSLEKKYGRKPGSMAEVYRKFSTDRVVHAKVEVLPVERVEVEGEMVRRAKLPRTFATGLGCVRAAMGAILATYEAQYKRYNLGLLDNREKRIRSISGYQFSSDYLIKCLNYMIGPGFELAHIHSTKFMCPDRKRMEMTVSMNTRVALWGIIRDSCNHPDNKNIIRELMALDCGAQTCRWSNLVPGATLRNGALMSGHPFTSRLDDFDNQYHMIAALHDLMDSEDIYISVGSDDGWIAWKGEVTHEEMQQVLLEYSISCGAVWTELEGALIPTFRVEQFTDFANLRNIKTIDGHDFNAFGCHLSFKIDGESWRWVKIFGMVPCYFYDEHDVLQYAVPVYDLRKILVSAYTPHSNPKGISELQWRLSRLSGINDVIGYFYPINATINSSFVALTGGKQQELVATDEHMEFVEPRKTGLRTPHEVLELWCPAHPLNGTVIHDPDVITGWDQFKIPEDFDWASAYEDDDVGPSDKPYKQVVPNTAAPPAMKQRTLEVARNFTQGYLLMLERLREGQLELLTCNPRELAGKLGLSISTPELLQNMCKMTLGKAQVIKLMRRDNPDTEQGFFQAEFKRGPRTYTATVKEEVRNYPYVMLWFLNEEVNRVCGYPDIEVEVFVSSGGNKTSKANVTRKKRKEKNPGKQGFKRSATYEKPVAIKYDRKTKRMGYDFAGHQWEEEYEDEYDEVELEEISRYMQEKHESDERYREIVLRESRGSFDPRLYVNSRKGGGDLGY